MAVEDALCDGAEAGAGAGEGGEGVGGNVLGDGEEELDWEGVEGHRWGGRGRGRGVL